MNESTKLLEVPSGGEINENNTNELDSALSNTDANVEKLQRITWFDASMHLIKGNLGPGCLSIPYAFISSGWLLGSSLFLLVASQGIYSMCLLTFCKRLAPDHCITFMDVAQFALGKQGQRVVQALLFLMQGGVCTVFLALISTNLQAQTGMGHVAGVFVTTIALLGVVLLQNLKDLRLLSATANLFMITAIATSAIAGMRTFMAEDLPPPIPVATSEPGDIATFVSTMFFAFEGMGLVLPVENSFTTGYASQEEAVRANRRFGKWVLPLAMSTVAGLFLLIGTAASVGFPDLDSGSITAYLAQQFPDQPWFGFVNILVIVAVFFTFPLQLTPVMEVLDEWFAPGCRPRFITNDDDSTINASCFGAHEWIARRYMVVFGCTTVVLAVENLSLLISLFGAVGQTGLALLPCLIHLNLQWQGIAPKHNVLTLVDIFTIGFSLLVMVSGVIFSVHQIIEEWNNRDN